MLNISPTSISALNSKEMQPPNAKDAFIATILSVITITFAVIHARGGYMNEPLGGEKEDQQEAINAIQQTHMALFPVPAPTFRVLKGSC